MWSIMKFLQQGFKRSFEMVNLDVFFSVWFCNCNQGGPPQWVVAVIRTLRGNNTCEVDQSINHYDSKLNGVLQF